MTKYCPISMGPTNEVPSDGSSLRVQEVPSSILGMCLAWEDFSYLNVAKNLDIEKGIWSSGMILA